MSNTLHVLLAGALLTSHASAARAQEPEPGETGTLLVYRERSYQLALIKPGIVVGGQEYASLPSGGCMSLPLAPGRHRVALMLSERYQGNGAREVALRANETTYVRLAASFDPQDGGFTYKTFYLMEDGSSDGARRSNGCKPIDPVTGRKFKRRTIIAN